MSQPRAALLRRRPPLPPAFPPSASLVPTRTGSCALRAATLSGRSRSRRAPPAVLVLLRAGAAGARGPRRLARRPPAAGHAPQEGAHGGAEHGAGRARLHLQPALHREELPAQGAAPLRVHCHRPRYFNMFQSTDKDFS